MMYPSSRSLSLNNSKGKIIRYETQFKHPSNKEDGFTLVSLKLFYQVLNSILNDFNRGVDNMVQDIKSGVDEMMFMITRLID